MAPIATADPTDHIRNGIFDAGEADWFAYGTTTSGISGGQFCVTFGFIGANPGGPNPVPALFTLNGSACN